MNVVGEELITNPKTRRTGNLLLINHSERLRRTQSLALRNGVLAQTFFHSRSRSRGVVRVNGLSLGTYQLFRPVRLTSR